MTLKERVDDLVKAASDAGYFQAAWADGHPDFTNEGLKEVDDNVEAKTKALMEAIEAASA
jgi:hypothetical protein